MRVSDQNKEALLKVANHLGPFASNVVYIGGAIIGFLITDIGAPPIRTTDDVDLVIEATTVFDYQVLDKNLNKLGFRNDPNRHRCAYLVDDVKVDILPSEPSQHGLKGDWLKPALQHFNLFTIKDVFEIRIVQAPYFLALKLEAFADRGKEDFLHKDIEDIIALIDGRPELLNEITAEDKALKSFVRTQFTQLKPDLIDYTEAHLGSAEKLRVPIVHARIDLLASLTI